MVLFSSLHASFFLQAFLQAFFCLLIFSKINFFKSFFQECCQNFNTFDPDQDRQNLILIWVQTVWHSDGTPEIIFQKSWYWNKSTWWWRSWNFSIFRFVSHKSSTIQDVWCVKGRLWILANCLCARCHVIRFRSVPKTCRQKSFNQGLEIT